MQNKPENFEKKRESTFVKDKESETESTLSIDADTTNSKKRKNTFDFDDEISTRSPANVYLMV